MKRPAPWFRFVLAVALALGCSDLLGLSSSSTANCERDAAPDGPPMCGCGGPACGMLNASTTTCDAGTCVPTCVTGFDTCAGDTFVGCTTDLRSDPKNCGRCGHVCAPGTCIASLCQPVPVVTLDAHLVGALAVESNQTLWVLGYSPDDHVTSNDGELVTVESTGQTRVVERVNDAGEQLPIHLAADGANVYVLRAALLLNSIDIGGGIIVTYYSLPYSTTLFGLTGSDAGVATCMGDGGAGYSLQDPLSPSAAAIAVDDASVYVAPPEGPIAVFPRGGGVSDGGCGHPTSRVVGPATTGSTTVQYNGVVSIPGGVAYAISSAAPSCIGLSTQADASLSNADDCTALAFADGCLYWVEYSTVLRSYPLSATATCVVPDAKIATTPGALKAIAVGGGVLYVSRTSGANGGAVDAYREGRLQPVQTISLGGGPVLTDVPHGFVYFAQGAMVYKLALP